LTVDEGLAKTIAGEITLSENPTKTLKKWREIFGLNQRQLAKKMGVSASVVSDYEGMRRRNPGAGYVKKTVEALLSFDRKKEVDVTQGARRENPAILDIREFLEPFPVRKIIRRIRGTVVSGKPEGALWGYTVVDSIRAILSLTDREFADIYGSTTERALVFTKVKSGRSPMIALKVTQPKPAMVVLHGLTPARVDKLAIKIAEVSKIPLVVSTLKDEEALIEKLREITA
jgi:putative transcriptional regulator